MGVKHSKQSVDISSTPKKAGVPVEEVNGKTVEGEKVEAITKVCLAQFCLAHSFKELFYYGWGFNSCRILPDI